MIPPKIHQRLTFCASTLLLLTLACVTVSAVNQPPDQVPVCIWGDWSAYDPIYSPSVQLWPEPVGAEPLTAGQPATIYVYAGVQYGLARRTAQKWPCQSETMYNYGQWRGAIKEVFWWASNTTPQGGSPTLTDQSSTDPDGGVYSVDLTPLGSGTINFVVSATNLDSSYPAWLATDTKTLPFIVIPPMRLGFWRFNDSQWHGEEGQVPSAANNLENVIDWNYGALKMDPPNPANTPILQYPAYQSDGSPNVTRRMGTVRFWYKPSSSWSTSPPATATLFQMQTADQTPVWSLDVVPGANSTSFTLTTSDTLSVSTWTFSDWTADNWYQIVVTYSPGSGGGTQLYINGSLLAGSTSAVADFSDALSTFTIGNSYDGFQQARGIYDELETFNYVLDYTTEIKPNYDAALALDSDGDGVSNLAEMKGPNPTDPYNPDTDGDGVNDHDDAFPTNPYRWDPDNSSDITPPVIQLIEPITANPYP